MELRNKYALMSAMADEEMSVRRLAAEAGCSFSFIQQLKTGARTGCSAELAARIAWALNVSRETLFVSPTSSDTPRTVERPSRKARSTAVPA